MSKLLKIRNMFSDSWTVVTKGKTQGGVGEWGWQTSHYIQRRETARSSRTAEGTIARQFLDKLYWEEYLKKNV